MRLRLALVLPVFFGFLLLATAGFAFDEECRTANRSVTGRIIPPSWMFDKPEHYEFTPAVSNWDPQHQHPAAWAGQDWDPAEWRSGWTSDVAIKRFFAARIFERLYFRGKTPAVELGPTFYKLSDLDQRRTLKLLTDRDAVFQQGHKIVELVDWTTHEVVGAYTPKGMFLN